MSDLEYIKIEVVFLQTEKKPKMDQIEIRVLKSTFNKNVENLEFILNKNIREIDNIIEQTDKRLRGPGFIPFAKNIK